MADLRELPATPTSPFPGLRPFEPTEEAIFRGRQRHTDELLKRLSSHRFLSVVGTSGSGKSSLVRAGLLPALDRGYLIGATSRWRVAIFRPGMAPIDRLVEALRDEDALGAADETKIRSSTVGLVDTVRDAALAPGESLLVVVDQFEELFRYQRSMYRTDRSGDADFFVRLLLTAVRRPDVPVYVVLTMRSDFLGDCSLFPGLPEVLTESQYLIPRLSRDERKQAIEEPLALFGASITPQLVEQLLNDSVVEVDEAAFDPSHRASAPDSLPVLQHALMRTYAYWKSLPMAQAGKAIDLRHYADAGQMALALDRHAEDVYTKRLDESGRRWTERIFRSLTTTELGRPVRRPTPRNELFEIVGAGKPDIQPVNDVLDILRHRDNSFVHISKDGTVDITHESLIWKWSRLGKWVTQEAVSADTIQDLVGDAEIGTTWNEPKLSAAIKRRDDEQWNASWARQYSKGNFDQAMKLLGRSRDVVNRQRWYRWLGVSALFMLPALALSVWLYEKANSELRLTSGIRDQFQNQLAGNAQRLNDLQAQLDRAKADPQANIQTITNLEDQLRSTKADNSRLQEAVQQTTTLQGSVASLQKQLDQTNRDLKDSQTRAGSLQTQLDQARKDLADRPSQGNRSNLQPQLDQANKDLAAERAQNTQLADELRRTQADLNDLRAHPQSGGQTQQAGGAPSAEEQAAFQDLLTRYVAAFKADEATRARTMAALWTDERTWSADFKGRLTGCHRPEVSAAGVLGEGLSGVVMQVYSCKENPGPQNIPSLMRVALKGERAGDKVTLKIVGMTEVALKK